MIGKFNIRQNKYRTNRIAGMNQYNAARAAGYSENTADKHTKDLDERISIIDTMERLGLTDRVLIDKLIELLGATKVIGYLHNYKKEGKGGIEKVSPDEVISNEFLDIPDNTIRTKALELALKLKGQLRDKVDHNVAIAYTEMKRIVIEHKNMDLDLGEDIPQPIKERMK